MLYLPHAKSGVCHLLRRGISPGEGHGFASAFDAEQFGRTAGEPEDADAAIKVYDLRCADGFLRIFVHNGPHQRFADFGIDLVKSAGGDFKNALASRLAHDGLGGRFAHPPAHPADGRPAHGQIRLALDSAAHIGRALRK